MSTEDDQYNFNFERPATAGPFSYLKQKTAEELQKMKRETEQRKRTFEISSDREGADDMAELLEAIEAVLAEVEEQ